MLNSALIVQSDTMMQIAKNRSSNKGFTLIEVLIALLIIAIGLPALLYTISSQLNQLSYLEEKLFSQWVASNEIQKLQIANRESATMAAAKDSGTEFMAGRKWFWRTESKEFTSQKFKGIYAVRIQVSLEESTEDPIITDFAYLYNYNLIQP